MSLNCYCECGAPMCDSVDTRNKGIVIQPCQKCLDAEYERGLDEGYRNRQDEEGS